MGGSLLWNEKPVDINKLSRMSLVERFPGMRYDYLLPKVA